MEVKLVVVGGKTNKREFLLTLPTVIGRSRQAGLTVAHPMISRQHCEIFELAGQLMIRDLKSLNGTFVGGERISEVPLHPADQFSIGPLTFRLQSEPSGGEAAEPAAGIPQQEPAVDEGAVEFVAESPSIVQAESGGQPEATPASRETPAAAEEPAIAPADGELPDFSTWGQADEEPVRGEEAAAEPAVEEIVEPVEGRVPAEAATEPRPEEPDELPTIDFGAPPATLTQQGEAPQLTEPAGPPGPEAPQKPGKHQKPKKGWWPFGKGKAKKKAEPEEEPKEALPDEEPAEQEQPASARTEAEIPGPPSIETGEPAEDDNVDELPDFLPRDDSDAKPAGDDDELNDFLKGFK